MLGGLEDSPKLGVYCTGDRGACLKGVLGELSTRQYNVPVTSQCLAGVDGAGPTGLAEASVSGCSSRSRSAALTTITLGSEVVEVPVNRPLNDGAEPTGLAKASVSGCCSRSRSAALTTITLGNEVVEVPVSRPSSSAERSVGEVVEVPVEVAERSVREVVEVPVTTSIANRLATELLHGDTNSSMHTDCQSIFVSKLAAKFRDFPLSRPLSSIKFR